MKGTLIDNQLKRMEQYAENLEALIEDRTKDHQDEKSRAEELLYSSLPP